jgi:hypothetical protein
MFCRTVSQHVEDGRLAAAAVADDADELALGQREVDAIEDSRVAIALGQALDLDKFSRHR